MKKILFLISFWVMITILIGCNSSNDHQAVQPTISETKDGYFIYRLVTEKEKYAQGEPVKIYAELEYIGDEEEVTIYHADSPFHFPITEKARNYELGYAMNMPLLSTALIKGEPLREEYIPGNGTGYGETDKEDYVNFIKELWENGFPIGIYVVNGYANFSVTDENGVEEQFTIKGQIEFEVIEDK